MGVLDVWQLDDEAEAVYRAMLRNPDLALPALARHLELPVDAVARAVSRLQSLGLVRDEEDGRYVAAPPAATISGMLSAELADLEGRRTRLEAVRATLSSFAADHLAGQSRDWTSVPFELLSDEESFVAVEDLQRATTGEVLTCHPVVDIDVDAQAYVDIVERQLAAGRRMRAIYPAGVVEEAARLAYVRHWAAAGEEVRLLAETPPPLVVYGSEVALVSAHWDGRSGGRFLLHAPALVAMVRDLFELYWERAVPLRRLSNGGAVDESRQVLELLMLGAKDETVARHLGVSLRTVRRRVAELMDDLGAATRFQAGMEAVRRGLL